MHNNKKEIQLQNILGRMTVKLDNKIISSLISDSIVLVTGGGGSIGSELCRQIMKYNPKELIIFDIYENNLYTIELELKKLYPTKDIQAIIGSIRDNAKLEWLFETYHPQIIFHAAAHKHVPLMETSPLEAIKNNVIATYNLVNFSDIYKVKKFILISTDKAVNPTSIMGATKRLCEMIVQAKHFGSSTDFVAVRFGNVLESNGSVVPIFRKQIEAGGPVTVTHCEVTRFFMTITEAVSLILQATSYAHGGEIFVLDMGKPVKIYDLAKILIRLYGYEPDVDIPIKITGLRPGEKLYEELLMNEENLKKTKNKKIFIAEPLDITQEQVNKKISKLNKLIQDEDTSLEKVKKVMKKLVDTYIEDN